MESERVINVFSLNHDIVFEEICDYFKVPFKDGFYFKNNKYGHLANFREVTADQLISGDLNFFESGEYGINLIKLHGSLDIFAVEDKRLFLKSFGDASYVGSNYSEILKVEDRNLEICQKDGIRATNELCVYDSDGELQFLRRSLLTGAHKFQSKFDQIVPASLFEFFKTQLQLIDELSVIGYGFGDSHINDVLVDWLEKPSHIIKIYDPHRTNVPEEMKVFSCRIELIQGGLTKYFLSHDSSNESWISASKKKMLSFVRENLRKRRMENNN